jgi:hypothetical protein
MLSRGLAQNLRERDAIGPSWDRNILRCHDRRLDQIETVWISQQVEAMMTRMLDIELITVV